MRGPEQARTQWRKLFQWREIENGPELLLARNKQNAEGVERNKELPFSAFQQSEQMPVPGVHLAPAGKSWPFVARPWPEIVAHEIEIASIHPKLSVMADIAQSVIDTGSAHLVAGCTSLHDIWAVPLPLPEPPYSVVLVHTPDWQGNVTITHESASRQLESVTRPAGEAVALFWRFLIEKFGIHAARQHMGE